MIGGRSQRLDWIVRLCGGGVAILGAIWLALWLAGVAGRWSADGALVLKTNMALCMLLGGASLLLSSGPAPSPTRRWTAGVLAAVVFLVGALTLSEHVFAYDPGIDQFLATELPGAVGTAAPNRMGLPGSASLTLVGAGLLALIARRRKWAPYFGLAVLLIDLVPLIGFLYDVVEFYRQPRALGIAWPTVLAMLALGTGLIVAVRDAGPMVLLTRPDPGGVLLRRLLAPAIFLPLLFGFTVLQIERTGLFDPDGATGLLVATLIVGFSAMIWLSAAHLSRSDTARIEAELALRASKEAALRQHAEIEALYELAPLGLALLDTDLRYLRINERLAEMNGIPARDHIGRSVREIVPTLADQVEPLLRTIVETRQPVTGLELRGQTSAAAGVERVWEENLFPLRDPSGNVFGVGATVEEITERKQAEEQLKSLTATLEQRVSERTAEATALADQLRELAAELTMTEHRERQRLAKVLHDHVQQLLVAAKLHAGMLVSRQPDENLAASARLVNDLLEQTLSASRSLTAELSPPVLHESGLGPALQWLSRSMLEKHGLTVEVAFDAVGEPIVEDVRVFLFESTRELLFNTVKHAGVSRARVVVTRNPDRRVQVVVSDDGVGFDPARLSRKTTTGGLGLFSIQQRILHMGGRLEIDAAPGHGTRVTLVGPSAPAQSRVPAAQLSEPASGARQGLDGGSAAGRRGDPRGARRRSPHHAPGTGQPVERRDRHRRGRRGVERRRGDRTGPNAQAGRARDGRRHAGDQRNRRDAGHHARVHGRPCGRPVDARGRRGGVRNARCRGSRLRHEGRAVGCPHLGHSCSVPFRRSAAQRPG